MSHIIVLDSGPLGALANSQATPTSQAAHQWMIDRLAGGDIVVIPDIADYEVRRELVRARLHLSVRQLNTLQNILHTIPISSEQLHEAADLWAKARNLGKPATTDQRIDADMILIAQTRAAAMLYKNKGNTLIATTNTKHLELFADAREWQEII